MRHGMRRGTSGDGKARHGDGITRKWKPGTHGDGNGKARNARKQRRKPSAESGAETETENAHPESNRVGVFYFGWGGLAPRFGLVQNGSHGFRGRANRAGKSRNRFRHGARSLQIGTSVSNRHGRGLAPIYPDLPAFFAPLPGGVVGCPGFTRRVFAAVCGPFSLPHRNRGRGRGGFAAICGGFSKNLFAGKMCVCGRRRCSLESF